MLDPAAGTGGMLRVAEDHLRLLNTRGRLEVYGQELNAETYAICRSDMMLKGQDASHIVLGNSFSEDGFGGQHFDYLLANPPFGVEWKKVEKAVRDEHESKGFAGRFGGGLPRINRSAVAFATATRSTRSSTAATCCSATGPSWTPCSTRWSTGPVPVSTWPSCQPCSASRSAPAATTGATSCRPGRRS